ncbi:hypothetical protein XENTR_v10014270 [Xenopus tropicalis]|nr:hypothetical protein XENTR_v10014270 [Xenopus tropicalis]
MRQHKRKHHYRSFKEHWQVCSCRTQLTGKYCEDIIDFCRLFSFICLHEGLFLKIIRRFVVKNLIYDKLIH